jgi:NADPH-dependent F420 reductase
VSAAIAILGGTGKEGRGLAARWTRAGHSVTIGSRDAGRAAGVAVELTKLAGARVEGATNVDAAANAQIAVVTTPFEGAADTAEAAAAQLAGKLVVSAVVPMRIIDGRFAIEEVPEGSAAQQLAGRLPESRVGAAFHTVSAKLLLDLGHDLDEDVPVAADDDADSETILGLCADLGAHGVVVGPLSLAHYIESQTAVLASVNKLHRSQAGIRFTGLP